MHGHCLEAFMTESGCHTCQGKSNTEFPSNSSLHASNPIRPPLLKSTICSIGNDLRLCRPVDCHPSMRDTAPTQVMEPTSRDCRYIIYRCLRGREMRGDASERRGRSYSSTRDAEIAGRQGAAAGGSAGARTRNARGWNLGVSTTSGRADRRVRGPRGTTAAHPGSPAPASSPIFRSTFSAFWLRLRCRAAGDVRPWSPLRIPATLPDAHLPSAAALCRPSFPSRLLGTGVSGNDASYILSCVKSFGNFYVIPR